MNRRERRAARSTHRAKDNRPKNSQPEVRNPRPAYEVVTAHAHFREMEHETGIGCIFDFHNHPGEGIEFCRDLVERANLFVSVRRTASS